MAPSSRCYIYLCLGHNSEALHYWWSSSLFFFFSLRTHVYLSLIQYTENYLDLSISRDCFGMVVRFLAVSSGRCVLFYFLMKQLPRVAFQPDIFSYILGPLPIKIMPPLFSETQAAGQSQTIQKWYLEVQNEH